jgi:twitching motility protein PilU
VKINGRVVPVTTTPLSPEKTRETVLGVMNETQRREFVQSKELNFAISARGIGRFRVSAFYQRNLAGMVLRRIETRIPLIEDLGLPDIIKDLAMTKRGLVIFVGATGAGKSTSLAAMIGHRNRNSKGHIISVEDPIEYIHQHEGCIVTQREVGIDTESFEVALKNMLRQAPDVIMIGEVRTRQTMENAITFAETGHLCLCTLHANNANQALDRIMHFFPSERHPQMWMDLSMNLKAMVAQQLIPTPDGKGRRACVEVLINTPLASDLIRKGEVHTLKELMSKSNEQGMQTFDQHLYEMYASGEITYEDAIAHADSANDLRLMIKLGADSDPDALVKGVAGLKMQDDKEDDRGRVMPAAHR